MVIFRSCGNCYYYGKVCGLGKGKIAPVFCKKGDPKKFVGSDISWYHLLPDFLTVIFPMVSGVILAIFNFSWILVGMLLILVVLFFGGTAAVQGSLSCKYCKQSEIGCPAEKLFSKNSS